ncbi:MAG: PA0069 family radical SAM protein [Saprospiraceae bacterium]
MKGRGAQINTDNPFDKHIQATHPELNFTAPPDEVQTQYLETHPKTLINKVESPDVRMEYSMNPYQGCEHGCVYCYARNTHPYWGFSAGLDFESKILIKREAPQILAKKLASPKWIPAPIMLSGNTDCYQPAEAKFKLTRQILEVVDRFNHPVGIITKSALVLRDIDILKRLAEKRLVTVAISINSVTESTRRLLEPRTASIPRRLQVIKELSDAGIYVHAMLGPLIPGLTDHEIMNIIEAVSNAGAKNAGYIIVRLNGDVGEIFSDWAHKTYPDRAEKILNRIKETHGGTLNDSRFGTRMKGEGVFAEIIEKHFQLAKRKFMPNIQPFEYDLSLFEKTRKPQTSLFDLL